MKTLRKMTAAALLACVLTVSVSAGDIWTGYAPPPPPQETTETPGEAGDVITEALASLLSGLLTVL